jgi:hypothetical protein
VAILTSAIVLVGPVHLIAGHEAANLNAYRAAFLVAAAFCLVAIPAALTIHDSDAARTIRPRQKKAAGELQPATAGAGQAQPDTAGHPPVPIAD